MVPAGRTQNTDKQSWRVFKVLIRTMFKSAKHEPQAEIKEKGATILNQVTIFYFLFSLPQYIF